MKSLDDKACNISKVLNKPSISPELKVLPLFREPDCAGDLIAHSCQLVIHCIYFMLIIISVEAMSVYFTNLLRIYYHA